MAEEESGSVAANDSQVMNRMPTDHAGVADDDPPVDGRTARGHRTRTAIVDAVVALLEEGDLTPTRARIAERAGVSLRTINVHFQDRDALLVAVAQFQAEQILATAARLPAEGPLPARLHAFIEQRARILERMGPVRQAAIVHAVTSDALQAILRAMSALGRAEVQRVFRPELGAPADSDDDLLHAVDMNASWYAWHALRESGLSSEEAQRVMCRSLRALLGSDDAARHR